MGKGHIGTQGPPTRIPAASSSRPRTARAAAASHICGHGGRGTHPRRSVNWSGSLRYKSQPKAQGLTAPVAFVVMSASRRHEGQACKHHYQAGRVHACGPHPCPGKTLPWLLGKRHQHPQPGGSIAAECFLRPIPYYGDDKYALSTCPRRYRLQVQACACWTCTRNSPGRVPAPRGHFETIPCRDAHRMRGPKIQSRQSLGRMRWRGGFGVWFCGTGEAGSPTSGPRPVDRPRPTINPDRRGPARLKPGALTHAASVSLAKMASCSSKNK